MKKHSILWFGLVFAAQLYADANVVVKWYRGNEPVSLPYSHKFSWAKNDGVTTLVSRISVQFPKSVSAGKGQYTEVQAGGGTTMVIAKAVEDTVKLRYSDGSTGQFSYKLQMPASPPFLKGCQEMGLEVRKKSQSRSGFPIGIACEPRDGKALVTITAPGDAEWGESNLLEVEGKGERWKQYLLSKSKEASESAQKVTVNLRYDNKLSRVEVAAANQQGKTVQTIQKQKRVEFEVGVGVWSLSLSTPAATASGIQPGLSASVLVPNLIFGVQPGAFINYVLPISGEKANFYLLEVFAGRPFSAGTSFSIEPRLLYGALGFDYDPLSLQVRHNNVGLGLNLVYKFSSGADFSFGVTYNGLSGDSKYFRGQAEYRLAPGGLFRWGILAGYESLAVKATSGDRTFNQIFGNVVAAF